MRHLETGVDLVTGNPRQYTAAGLELADGRTVAADDVVWATGFRTGIEDVQCSRDGRPVQLPFDMPLFHHFLVPRCALRRVSGWVRAGGCVRRCGGAVVVVAL